MSPCVSQQRNEELIREPTPTEIKDAIFAIHLDKAPKPDGFLASFSAQFGNDKIFNSQIDSFILQQ